MTNAIGRVWVGRIKVGVADLKPRVCFVFPTPADLFDRFNSICAMLMPDVATCLVLMLDVQISSAILTKIGPILHMMNLLARMPPRKVRSWRYCCW